MHPTPKHWSLTMQSFYSLSEIFIDWEFKQGWTGQFFCSTWYQLELLVAILLQSGQSERPKMALPMSSAIWQGQLEVWGSAGSPILSTCSQGISTGFYHRVFVLLMWQLRAQESMVEAPSALLLHSPAESIMCQPRIREKENQPRFSLESVPEDV